MVRALYTHWQWVWALLGALASSATIISMLQHWAEIPLADLPAQFLAYYRGLIATLFGWIPLPFGWVIPPWYGDVLALTLVLALTRERTKSVAPLRLGDGFTTSPMRTAMSVLVSLLLPPILIWSLLIEFLLVVAFATGIADDEDSGLPKELTHKHLSQVWIATFALLLIVTVLASFGFFAMNASALSGA